MFSLQDLLGQQQGSEAEEQIASNVGADRSAVSTAIAAALPAILGGLANNAATPDGAQSLNNALEQDHGGGGVLGNLGGLAGMIFGGGQEQQSVPTEANAGGILGHVLGGNQGVVAQEVSQKSGLGMGQVAQILMFLAPIVMGHLGREKQQQNVGADGLGGLLGGILGGGNAQQQQQSSGNPMIDMASSMLDKGRDGSSMDDIASMAFNHIRGK